MRNSGRTHWLYRRRKHIEYCGVILLGTTFTTLQYDFTTGHFVDWPKVITALLIVCQTYSFVLVTLGVVLFLTGFYLNVFEKDWRFLQVILDAAQNRAYIEHNQNGDPKHFHRVTLFRYRKFKFFVKHWSASKIWNPWGKYNPFSGWLVPVLRSGQSAKKTRSIFVVPNTGNNEGIAGLAWSNESAVVIRDLPVVSSNNRNYRRKYADDTSCERDMVDYMVEMSSQRHLPRSIGGIALFVNSRLWGVLVFDSQNPKGVPEELGSDFAITVQVIQTILGDSI